MKHFFAKCCALLMLPVINSYADSLDLNGIAGAGNYKISVTSYAERRFKTVYKQQYDFSCGSAALASLLTFHYEDAVNEQNIFIDMFQNGDQEKIKQQGFSLLDMKNYLERKGYRSDGFKIELDKLLTVNAPAITIINDNGYLLIDNFFSKSAYVLPGPSAPCHFPLRPLPISPVRHDLFLFQFRK